MFKPSKRKKFGGNEPTKDEEDFKPDCRKSRLKLSRHKVRHGSTTATPSTSGVIPTSTKQLDDHCNDSGRSVVKFCPICQFPYKYLVGQSEEWHTMDCLASSEKASLNIEISECAMGLKCNSISQDHYRRYSHNKLAVKRSNSSLFEHGSGTSESHFSNSEGHSLYNAEQQEHENEFQQGRFHISDTSLTDDSMFKDGLDDIISEIIDELENVSETSETANVPLPSEEFSYKNLESSSVATCSVGSNTTKDSSNIITQASKKIFNENFSTSPSKSASSMATQTDSKTESEIKVGEHGNKTLLQTGLDSYFGVKKNLKQSFRKTVTTSASTTSTRDLPNERNSITTNEKQSFNKKRSCPFYKKIPGTSITVDAFSYGDIPGCTAYFLSHFHYDHYGGLKKNFNHRMYCSEVTAALVRLQIKVSPQYIHALPLSTELEIEGVKVTLLDANHCPGSVMFLFVLPDGRRILHTGDFRAVPSMCEYAALQNVKIDVLYLDTTYCNPLYNFPTQQSTIDFAAEKSLRAVQMNPKTLIVCGTYSVGKERVFVSIANALDCKICANTSKKRILSSLNWGDLEKRLTTEWNSAQVHVLPMNSINVKALTVHLKSYHRFQELLAFKPTGWTYNSGLTDLHQIRPTKSGPVTIYGIPYSEHSSFSELEWFIKRFRPAKILPTVNNGSYQKRNEMQRIFANWSASSS